MFSVARPHSHVVSPLKYPHFFLCSLLQVYPVLSLFRHLQLSQGLSCPVARSSYRLTKPACAFSSSLLFHSLTRTTFAKTPKIPHYTAIHTDREHKQGGGGGLITLIMDDITFTNKNIPKAINTHNTELHLNKIHIGKTKDITVANAYFPPRDTT